MITNVILYVSIDTVGEDLYGPPVNPGTVLES